LVLGGQEACQATPAPGEAKVWHRPVEVLLQQSEDLMAQLSPEMAEYPALDGELGTQVQEMEQSMTMRLLKVAEVLGDAHGGDLAKLAEERLDRACEVLFCLDAQGLLESLYPHHHLMESVAALRRFQFLRWAGPIHSGGTEAAALVVGPFLSELFRECDDALEQPADVGSVAPVMLYVTHAEALASLQAAFGLTGAQKPAEWNELSWPRFGASLELVLVEAEGGELFFQMVDSGGLISRDLVPYDLLRKRFSSSFC